jgi:pectin methylesterase-like acyl-CoA thioesterase
VGSLAALGWALGSRDEEAAGRGRKHRRRRRKRGGNAGGAGSLGDTGCFVCEKLSDGPNCRFTSIQTAVNSAGDGASITVCPGTYKERLSFSAITAPNLSIVGSGAENTTIDGDGDGSTIAVGRPGFVSIERFTITGGSAAAGSSTAAS